MTQRAAVLIGVEKAGRLPRLQAVGEGINHMKDWAEAQPGMDGRVRVHRDGQNRKVRAYEIYETIREFVEDGAIEQLFVYFAGHGVNRNYQEFWLLSGAPDNPNEAVNLAGSAMLARYCGIPHVVLISDACRVAADSIQAQAVEGSLIFPNDGPNVTAGCVDLFYATLVGRPAFEVKDPNNAAAGFQAVYTEVLAEGLRGLRPEIVEPLTAPPVRVIRAHRLKDHLKTEVPRRLLQLGVSASTMQQPDAVITSEPSTWLAEVPGGAGATPMGGPFPTFPRRRNGHHAGQKEPESLLSASHKAIQAALNADAGAANGAVESLAAVAPPAGTLFLNTLNASRVAPPPEHFEIQNAIRVIGTTFAEALSGSAGAEVLRGDGSESSDTVVCITGTRPMVPPEQATNVLVVFQNGTGTLIPAIPGYNATLTYHDSELASVSFEPSPNSNRYPEFRAEMEAIRELRGVIASASRLGVLRLDQAGVAGALINRLRHAKSFDPSIAVYTAYALHERGETKNIDEMRRILTHQLETCLFDVEMLAMLPRKKWEADVLPPGVFPAVPMLSQGWSLLEAQGIMLPLSLRSLRGHLMDSLWTLLDVNGVDVVRNAIHDQEIR